MQRLTGRLTRPEKPDRHRIAPVLPALNAERGHGDKSGHEERLGSPCVRQRLAALEHADVRPHGQIDTVVVDVMVQGMNRSAGQFDAHDVLAPEVKDESLVRAAEKADVPPVEH